jgi:peptide/nickel transport system substrate-binding protein
MNTFEASSLRWSFSRSRPPALGDAHRRPLAARSAAGQMIWAVHISLAPDWFDPAETSGIITPFMVLYALHDAMLKPLPGNAMTPSLAESWSMSPDGLVYEFVLRRARGSTTASRSPPRT